MAVLWAAEEKKTGGGQRLMESMLTRFPRLSASLAGRRAFCRRAGNRADAPGRAVACFRWGRVGGRCLRIPGRNHRGGHQPGSRSGPGTLRLHRALDALPWQRPYGSGTSRLLATHLWNGSPTPAGHPSRSYPQPEPEVGRAGHQGSWQDSRSCSAGCCRQIWVQCQRRRFPSWKYDAACDGVGPWLTRTATMVLAGCLFSLARPG